MTVKIIRFGEAQNVTNPGDDGVRFSFPFTVIDSCFLGAPEEEKETEHHRVNVFILDSRKQTWGFKSRRANDDPPEPELMKVLFELGKRHVIELVKTGTLPKQNTILLTISHASHPGDLPFNPNAIVGPPGEPIEVEVKREMGFRPASRV
jgi:hypothetical protein